MTETSFFLAGSERCERPRQASFRTSVVHPGRLAHGPEENKEFFGRVSGGNNGSM